jgi:hypothetical protein
LYGFHKSDVRRSAFVMPVAALAVLSISDRLPDGLVRLPTAWALRADTVAWHTDSADESGIRREYERLKGSRL